MSTAIIERNVVAPNAAPNDLYRLLLFRKMGSELLVVGEREPFTLPCIEIPKWERVAENLTAAISKRYGMAAICLFAPALPHITTGCEFARYEAMEFRAANRGIPHGMHWVPIDALSEQSFADREDRVGMTHALQQISEFQSDPDTGPFGKPGWIEELLIWVQREIETYGLRLTGELRQLNATPNFSLLRLKTNGAAVWFKAVGDPNSREFPISVTLARLFPGFVPTVIATRPDLNGWLSLESGSATLDVTEDDRAWERAAETLSRLQIDSLGKTEHLLKAGCRDLCVTSLLSMVGPFMEVISQLMERQQTSPPHILDRSELHHLEVQIREALTDWGELGIPDTLGHLDFNPGNIRCAVDQCVFLDWAEAYVGLPFPTLQFLLEHARQELPNSGACSQQLITGYNAPWLRTASPAAVARAQELTPLLAAFLYAVALDAWHDPELVRSPRLAGFFRSQTRRMQRETKALSAYKSEPGHRRTIGVRANPQVHSLV